MIVKRAGFNAPLDLSINKLGKKLILEVFLKNKLFTTLNQDEVEYIVNSHFEEKVTTPTKYINCYIYHSGLKILIIVNNYKIIYLVK